MKNSNEEPDINDVFDSLVTGEQTVVESSYGEGELKGKTEGQLEGYHLGFHRGAEIGSEVGYYLSFAGYYLRFGDDRLNPKISSALVKLKTLAESIPKSNEPDVDILSSVVECRGIFKKACVHLKVSPRLPNPLID